MNAADTELFERERPRLVGLSYRLLGSVSDAEDVVQEAWLRWRRTDRSGIERPQAWLTTVTSRIGLDLLRARQRDRIDYVGPWLPEPLVQPLDKDDPARVAEVTDSLTTAYLVLLETLSPPERLVLLLADVFAEPFASIAVTVGKSEATCRKIAERARTKVRGLGEDRSRDAAAESLATAWEFSAALLSGDVEHVKALLADDAILVSDGGKDAHAARRPVRHASRIARLLCNIARRIPAGVQMEPVWINGSPGVLATVDGAPVFAQALDVNHHVVTRVHIIVAPDKLANVERRVDLV